MAKTAHTRPACPFPKRWKLNAPWSCPECHRVWVLRLEGSWDVSFKTWKDTGVSLDV
jgi:hypothetical protein